MRNALVWMISLLLLCATSWSQEYKRAEVFGGFQYAHVYPNANGAGWNTAVTGNLTRAVGTADFSGRYERGSALYT